MGCTITEKNYDGQNKFEMVEKGLCEFFDRIELMPVQDQIQLALTCFAVGFVGFCWFRKLEKCTNDERINIASHRGPDLFANVPSILTNLSFFRDKICQMRL